MGGGVVLLYKRCYGYIIAVAELYLLAIMHLNNSTFLCASSLIIIEKLIARSAK